MLRNWKENHSGCSMIYHQRFVKLDEYFSHIWKKQDNKTRKPSSANLNPINSLSKEKSSVATGVNWNSFGVLLIMDLYSQLCLSHGFQKSIELYALHRYTDYTSTKVCEGFLHIWIYLFHLTCWHLTPRILTLRPGLCHTQPMQHRQYVSEIPIGISWNTRARVSKASCLRSFHAPVLIFVRRMALKHVLFWLSCVFLVRS